MHRPFSALVGLAALAGLAACQTAPDPEHMPTGPSGADNHRIQVSEAGERLEVPVGAQDLALSRASQQNVAGFAQAYSQSGHGPLTVSTPSGGANAAAASRMAQQVRMVLAENGVPYGAIAATTYDASGAAAAPITVSYMHFEATAPECTPIWAQDLAHPRDNQEYESFGCAAAANLAALVADPRDLIQPRDETARDSGRRGAVLGHYRNGEQTHSVRSADERVTISNAVN